MGKIFITGSSGGVGSRLALRLLAEGNEVIGFDIRKPHVLVEQQSSYRHISGDIADPAALSFFCDKADAAIHCAALLPQKNYLGKDAFVRVNTQGAVNFMQACLRCGISKAVVISNTGVLASKGAEVIDDSAAYRKKGSPYIISKVLAEKAIGALALKEKIYYCILRPSAIYGDGIYYKWGDIFEMAKRNRLFVIAPADKPYAVIHIDDLIDAILLALAKLENSVSGEKIIVTSQEKISIYELMRAITDCLKTRPPARIPFLPAFLGSGMLQAFAKITQNEFLSSVTPENMIDYKNGLFFDHTKAQRLLQFVSRRAYREEMPKMVKAYFDGRKN